jgi:hypothetical protein
MTTRTFEQVQNDLRGAIERGDVPGVQAALEVGAVPTEGDLGLAIESGVLDVARAIQGAGEFDLATVWVDEYGRAPIHAAAASGNSDMVDWVGNDADMMAVDELGNTPAHEAMLRIGHYAGMHVEENPDTWNTQQWDDQGLATLRALYADGQGVDLNQPNHAGERPIETLQKIIRAGDPNATLAEILSNMKYFMDSIGAGLDDVPAEEKVAEAEPVEMWDAINAQTGSQWTFRHDITCAGDGPADSRSHKGFITHTASSKEIIVIPS